MAIYLELTRRFNSGKTRAILSGGQHPELIAEIAVRRPLLNELVRGREAVEIALDAERRRLIHENEDRLSRYLNMTKGWALVWPEVSEAMKNLPLQEAHKVMVERARIHLPAMPESLEG